MLEFYHNRLDKIEEINSGLYDSNREPSNLSEYSLRMDKRLNLIEERINKIIGLNKSTRSTNSKKSADKGQTDPNE